MQRSRGDLNLRFLVGCCHFAVMVEVLSKSNIGPEETSKTVLPAVTVKCRCTAW
jgi:hypothetical protein